MIAGIARMVAIIVGTALLAACGFHLRGSEPLAASLNPLAIESVRTGSALLPPLRAALADAGAEFARADDSPGSVLRIGLDEHTERVIAVTPQGRPREVELTYRVSFELLDADGASLQQRDLVLTREFAVNERDVLGKTLEADALRSALVRDMVSTIVRNLAAAGP